MGRGFEENYGRKIGELIYKTTERMVKSHKGVNTHFGSILLHAPLFKASLEIEKFDLDELISNTNDIIEYSDVEDSINFYNAINAVEIGGLGERDDLDANSTQAIEEISKREISFDELMKISKERDKIAKELVNSYERTQTGYNYLKDKEINNETLIKGFIFLLQEPDTHIIKIHTEELAEEIAEKATEIANENYPLDEIKKLDKELNKKGISPGTTADIFSASIFLRLLDNE